MFALFFSLYYAMFKGSWALYTFDELFGTSSVNDSIRATFNPLGKLLTSIFNDGQVYSNFGAEFFTGSQLIIAVCLVLALITSIGIVVMAVKGIKRVFGVFFMGVR